MPRVHYPTVTHKHNQTGEVAPLAEEDATKSTLREDSNASISSKKMTAGCFLRASSNTAYTIKARGNEIVKFKTHRKPRDYLHELLSFSQKFAGDTRRGDAEEAKAGLGGHGLGQHSLAGPWWSIEQHALGRRAQT